MRARSWHPSWQRVLRRVVPSSIVPVADSRHFAIKGLDLSDKSVLEIGALTRPIVARGAARAVSYMDHASTDALHEKYRHEPSIDVDAIVAVDFVAHDGRIASNVGAQKFDVVVAAHVVEHVPDLIGWLEEAESILEPGGVIALIVPDKRYTFDVCRRLSPRREVEAAYREKRTRVGLWNVMDHFTNAVAANTAALWARPESAIEFAPTHTPDDVQRAIEIWNAGHYVDCHAWVFTPDHFLELMTWAFDAFSIPLRVSRFIDTQVGDLEFYVQLQSTKLAEKPTRD